MATFTYKNIENQDENMVNKWFKPKIDQELLLELKQRKDLAFSISATSRKPRENEIDGKDYFFLSKEDFISKIKNGKFLEYEEVYDGTFYGTLIDEVEKNSENGKHVVFGKVIKGMDLVDFMENQQTDNNDRPINEIKIVDTGLL